MGPAVVSLSGVVVRRGGRAVVDGVDLVVRRGRQTVLLGPSGAGKSTLLRVLAGQLVPDAGTVTRDGVTGGTGGRAGGVGLVPQEPLLMPWLTVRENVALGQGFAANRTDAALVDRLVELLGLTDRAQAYPDELSGGQAQRAALGRALAVQPDLLLLDEPFSALDPVTRGELQQWLRTTVTDLHLTSVVVTHDLDEALVLADEIVVLGHGGRVVRRWDVEPATDVAAAGRHPLRPRLAAAYRPDPQDPAAHGRPGAATGAPALAGAHRG